MSYIIKMALDIKARFQPPAPMTSPLEAYCALGVIAKALKLDRPQPKDTLFDMREELKRSLNGREPEDERIANICSILFSFIRNAETNAQMMEYVSYGYDNER